MPSGARLNNPGFQFTGWSCQVKGLLQPNDSYVIQSQDDTCSAQWRPTHHTLSYDVGGGTGRPPASVNKLEGSRISVSKQAGVSRSGYVFAGWSDGATLYRPLDNYTLGLNDVTLTAVWTPLYKVSFRFNGPGNYVSAKSATQGSVVATPRATLVGYALAGWACDIAGNIGLQTTYTMGASDDTCRAQWAPLRTIIYRAGTGRGSTPATSRTAQGSEFIVASAYGLSLRGATFVGWTDGVTLYQPGDSYGVGNSNVTLTAVFASRP